MVLSQGMTRKFLAAGQTYTYDELKVQASKRSPTFLPRPDVTASLTSMTT
jgi:hypothetical protein